MTLMEFFSIKKKLISVSLAGTMVLCGCNKKETFQHDEGMIWNTLYHISYSSAQNYNDSIINIMNRVGKSLSIFDNNSLVSKVNSQDTTKIDDFFETVYLTSLKVNKNSKGMFDPTVSPLITAWGFGPGHDLTVDSLVIDSVMDFVGIQRTKLTDEGFLIKEDKRTQFNFSAIAKGFGCDIVGEMFKRNNIENYMVEIGGEIAVAGMSPSGKKWRISIDTPEYETDVITHNSFTIIEVTDCGIATSGNYRNYHETENGIVAHTISPITGYPVQTEIISATVIAPTAMEADAVATACMASGLEDAKEILSQMGFEALLILQKGTYLTPGFTNLIIKEDKY